MIECYWNASHAYVDASSRASAEVYAPDVTTLDLHRLRLRPGEARDLSLEVELAPFVLAGQRYEVTPVPVSVALRVSQASGATVFDVRFLAHVSGPCMRCLAHAEVDADVSARELHDGGADLVDDLRSDYVTDDVLEVGAWVRDAIALAIPEQILCRPDCAGLCPACGKDLNVEPHEHADLEVDPRWAALEELRESL
jgi:uncharacterized protein